MRQHAQLDLRIVGVHQEPARPGREEAAHLAPEVRAHGYVLKVRLRGADAPRAGFGLVEAGMDPSVAADDLQKAVAVGGFQLGQRAVFQHHLHGGVVVAQVFQNLRACGVPAFRLFAGMEPELCKQRLPELLRGVDVEFVPDGLIDFGLDLRDAILKVLPVLPDSGGVHREPDGFHAREHARERLLDFGQELALAVLFDLRRQAAGEPRKNGRRARLFGNAVIRGRRNLIFRRKAADAVIRGGGVQKISRQHGVHPQPFHRNPEAVHRGKKRLAVVRVLDDLSAAAQRAQERLVRIDDVNGSFHGKAQLFHPVFAIDGDKIRAPRFFQRDQQRGAVFFPFHRKRPAVLLRSGPLRGRVQPEFRDQRKKLQLRHQARRGLAVLLFGKVVGKLGIDGNGAADRPELPAQISAFLPLPQPSAHPFLDVEGFQIFVDAVEVVVFLHKLARALRPDARNARYVVGAVALDRLDVDHLGRRDPVLLPYFLFVVHRDVRLAELGGRKAHGDAVPHKLQAVAVAGRDDALLARLAAGARQRAEDVVGLVPRAFQQMVAHLAQKLLQLRKLLRQLVGHPFALGLVARVFLMAERRLAPVERDRDPVRLRFVAQLLQHGQEAVDPVGEPAILRGEELDPVKRPVQDAVSV